MSSDVSLTQLLACHHRQVVLLVIRDVAVPHHEDDLQPFRAQGPEGLGVGVPPRPLLVGVRSGPLAGEEGEGRGPIRPGPRPPRGSARQPRPPARAAPPASASTGPWPAPRGPAPAAAAAGAPPRAPASGPRSAGGRAPTAATGGP